MTKNSWPSARAIPVTRTYGTTPRSTLTSFARSLTSSQSIRTWRASALKLKAGRTPLRRGRSLSKARNPSPIRSGQQERQAEQSYKTKNSETNRAFFEFSFWNLEFCPKFANSYQRQGTNRERRDFSPKPSIIKG